MASHNSQAQEEGLCFCTTRSDYVDYRNGFARKYIFDAARSCARRLLGTAPAQRDVAKRD